MNLHRVSWMALGLTFGAAVACETVSGVEEGADGLELLFKRPLGEGYSLLVDDGDGRLVTMLQEDGTESVVALDADTGDELWRSSYPEDFEGDGYGPGPNAAPVVVGELVLTVGLGGMLSALERESGELRWRRNLPAEFGAEPPDHGYASSPVAFEGMAITAVGGPGAGAVAFDLEDGSVRWQAHEFDVGYASPSLMEFEGRTFVLFYDREAFVAVDPKDGAELWRFEHRNAPVHNAALPPLRCADDLLWSSARSGSNNSGTRAFRLTATGLEELYWDRRSKVEPYANAIARDGVVYACIGTGRGARLVAMDARSGEIAWEQRGYRAANVAWIGDELIVLGDEGLLVVGHPAPTGFEERSRAVLDSDRSWTQPTVLGERIFVRDREHLWAYRLSPPTD